jgi:hypothetical protein
MELQQMSYAWFARNDIILSLLIVGLFIYICDILVKYIVSNQTKTPIRPINYIFGLLKG